MPLYTLHRNYLHSSTLGVISFVKGEETMVPPLLEREIIAIGGRRVEGDNPDVLDAEKAAPIPLKSSPPSSCWSKPTTQKTSPGQVYLPSPL